MTINVHNVSGVQGSAITQVSGDDGQTEVSMSFIGLNTNQMSPSSHKEAPCCRARAQWVEGTWASSGP